MPKKKKITKQQKKEASKEDIIFKGGMNVDLEKRIKSKNNERLRDVLSQHVGKVLDQELKNDETLQGNLSRWHDMYKGKREPKVFPWEKCANVAIPISRSNTDAIFVRIVDAIFNKTKLWIVKAQKKELVGFARKLEDQLNWFQKYVLKLREKIMSPLLECVKTGTGVLMIVNEEDHDTRYAYATEAEIKDPSVKKYKEGKNPEGNSTPLVKRIDKSYIGPNTYPIPRSDWMISSDATSIQDAYICGFRTRYRLPQIELKVRQNLYDKKEVEKLTAPDEVDEATKRRAESQGKEVEKTDYEKPYEIWQLHLHYDVDEDGEEDDIIVTYHRHTGAILRCIYNPLFKGFRPFQDLVFYPTEYSFDGEGIVEILEPLQKVADTLTNQRLDTLTLMNAPWIFVRVGSGLEDLRPSPGKTIPVHGNVDEEIKIIQHPGNLQATFQEEDRINAYADRAVGITPAIMGISTSERPVAKETFALREEANKKFKGGIDHVRVKLSELAWILVDFFTQYQPTYKYGEMGAEETIAFPAEYLRDGINIELATSTEMLNQETRREVNMTVFMMIKDYMTSIAGMGQMLENPQIPSGFKKLLIDGSDISVKIFQRILEDFEIKDAEDLVLDLRKSIDVDKAVAQSIDNMPQQPPEGGEDGGQPPAAPPGAGGIQQ